MSDTPRVIVLCGSSRFADVMAVVGWLLEREEGAITMGIHLLPWWYGAAKVGPGDDDGHLAEREGVAAAMDELHLRKIDLADEVFVVDVGGYIGESTRREIEYARARGVRVRRFSQEALGFEAEGIHNEAVKAARAGTKGGGDE